MAKEPSDKKRKAKADKAKTTSKNRVAQPVRATQRKKSPTSSTKQKKKISLALQGGGAHGAFAWGVLDALLEDGRLEISAISGASAGAMNGAALISGYEKDGAEGARKALKEFWGDIKSVGQFSPFQVMPWQRLMGQGNLSGNPWFQWYQVVRHFMSPKDLNMDRLNPLRSILKRSIDFEALNKTQKIRFFASACDVKSGSSKLFRNADMCPDALLASAALPELMPAVKVGDRYYWDGGLRRNPDLDPLLHEDDAGDLVVIQINAIYRKDVPTTAIEIMDRDNEIRMNGNLLDQMSFIQKINDMIEKGDLKDKSGHFRLLRLHRISNSEAMSRFDYSSKYNTDPFFLNRLFEMGRETGKAWLKENYKHIGQKSSFSLDGRHVKGMPINPDLPQIKDHFDHSRQDSEHPTPPPPRP